MAFSVTYHQLAEHNIKNLYGGLPTPMRWRTTCSPTAISSPERNQDRQKRSVPEERFIMTRYCEYDPENRIHVPRAPAFRMLSRERVDDIVRRLSQPTISTNRRLSFICQREVKRSEMENCRKCKSASARTNYSPQAIEELTERMKTPTVTSNVRNSMRCLREMSVPDVIHSCERFSGSPSERFYRQFDTDTL